MRLLISVTIDPVEKARSELVVVWCESSIRVFHTTRKAHLTL
jgi:hypothetical protein